MIELLVNSSDPKAAIVAVSPFDDEAVLIPLSPATQKAWNRRAIDNRAAFNPTGFLILKDKMVSYNRYGILN